MTAAAGSCRSQACERVTGVPWDLPDGGNQSGNLSVIKGGRRASDSFRDTPTGSPDPFPNFAAGGNGQPATYAVCCAALPQIVSQEKARHGYVPTCYRRIRKSTV
jgi:hypothetical protein